MKTAGRVMVTGASGLLGAQVLLRLSQSGYQVTGLGRHDSPVELKSVCDWVRFDLTADGSPELHADVLIHCAPLWLLPGYLEKLLASRQLNRCIAMSSTSAIAKVNAHDQEDRALAQRLLIAEDKVKALAGDNVRLTILRPTLIYGYGKDKNVSVIAKFIRKFGFFPIAGKASGLRQPVHVDDLVTAISNIVDNPLTFGRTYNLTGADTISYREMLERIFEKLNKPPRILSLPIALYRLLLAIRAGDYSPGSANRMNQDLNYDSSPATVDFNYRPRGFLNHPEQDLV